MPMFPEGIGLPPGVREGDLPWGEHQAWGILMEEWMSGADGWKECPIKPSPLTWEELEQWEPLHKAIELSDWIMAEVDKLNLEAPFPDQAYHNLTIDGKTELLVDWELPPVRSYAYTTYFDAWIGEGVMMILGMFRRDGPQISSIALVSYKHYFPIGTLQHIFVLDIVNTDTKTFLNREFRPVHTPKTEEDMAAMTSEYGTDDYEGLLGTDVGKRAATIVIEGFERGTKTVGRIVTWRRTDDDTVEMGGDGLSRAIFAPDGQMRFEIDDLSPLEDVNFESDDDNQVMEMEPTMHQDCAGKKAAPKEGTADKQPGDDQGTAPEPEGHPEEMDLTSDRGEQPKEAGPGNGEGDSSGLSDPPSRLETPSDMNEEGSGSQEKGSSSKKRRGADPGYRGPGKRRKDDDNNPPPSPRRSARIAAQSGYGSGLRVSSRMANLSCI